MLTALLAGGLAYAGDPPPPAPPPATPAPDPEAARIAELEARILALEEAARKAAEDQFLRDAEALAAPEGPPPPQAAATASYNAMNPGITAFGDLVGQVGVDKDGLMSGSTMYLRSLELEFRADVDPFAKADAVIAFEQEAPPLDGGPGEGFGAEPEEAYVELVSLPWHIAGKVGKFRVPFGLMNRTHPHDLPWVDAPELLGEEGYNDTGIVLSYVQPIGPLALTLNAGALAGEPFDEDNEKASVTGFGRAELFVGAGNVDIGLGGSALKSVDDQVLGADFTLRWKPGQRASVVLIGEWVEGKAYAALQVQPGRNIYIGFREDLAEGELQHNLFVTYYTSEFLRLRVGGGYAPATGTVDMLGQLTFVWGSHPVEPWWVNR